MSMPLTTRQQKLQLCNLVSGIHDISCNCRSPLYHSAKIILEQLAPELKKEEKYQLKQCLTEETTTKEEDDGGFTTGDLEALFGENGDDTEGAAG